MIEAHIYVEGKNDRVFLTSFLEEVLGLTVTISGNVKKQVFKFSGANLEGQISILGSWAAIKKDFFQDQFIANEVDGIKTVLLLDADKSTNQGGFTVRQSEVEVVKARVDFEYFLIPNHQEDGYLETIFRNILVEDNQGLLDCIDANENCLRTAADQLSRDVNLFPLKSAEKAKLNYLRRLLKDLDNGNYKDNTIWNLNHPYLNPLKEFLSTQLGLD
jgi:hypothetical protein